MREEAVLFGSTRSLVGIITSPPQGSTGKPLPAVIFLNAGLVHRVGPNRLYVKMARDLATMGYVGLRFDLSGIGDSPVRADHLPFAQSGVREAQEAMHWLSATRGIERFVLIGLCSGAMVAFHTACCDTRVVGAVLINAQGGTSVEQAYLRRIARFYWKILLPKSWAKIVKGKIDYQRVFMALNFQFRSLCSWKRPQSDSALDMAAALRRLTARGGRLLLVYAAGDIGLDYLHVILGNTLQQMCMEGKIALEIIPRADHTFTLLWNQEQLLSVVHQWALALAEA